MSSVSERFLFASAPDSWGVLDYPGPSWKQSYEKMLDEMVSAGYTGTELGPYGFFPTDPEGSATGTGQAKTETAGLLRSGENDRPLREHRGDRTHS